jgi:hypothetical protein
VQSDHLPVQLTCRIKARENDKRGRNTKGQKRKYEIKKCKVFEYNLIHKGRKNKSKVDSKLTGIVLHNPSYPDFAKQLVTVTK